MKIAVIGGAGFIGTRLSYRLDESTAEFVVGDIDRQNLRKNSIYLDVEDPNTLEQLFDIDVLYQINLTFYLFYL